MSTCDKFSLCMSNKKGSSDYSDNPIFTSQTNKKQTLTSHLNLVTQEVSYSDLLKTTVFKSVHQPRIIKRMATGVVKGDKTSMHTSPMVSLPFLK